jgi:hypothetical protein
MTNNNRHRVNERNATTVPFPCAEIRAQGKQCVRHEFHEPVVAYQVRECPAHMSAYFLGVVVLECPVARFMKPNDDSHYFTERQFAFPHTFSSAIFQQLPIKFWLKYQTEIINVAEKFYELCYNIISHQELLSVE